MPFLNLNYKELEFLQKKLSYLKLSATMNETKYLDKILRRLNKISNPIKPRSRKAKGRNFQYQIAQDIANLLNIEFNQQDDNCLIHSREMGQRGVDIVLRGEALKKFPFSIETKNQENISLVDFINQAKQNQKENTDWLLILKNKRLKEPVVILNWKRFLKIYKEE